MNESEIFLAESGPKTTGGGTWGQATTAAWIESPLFDLFLLILVPLSILPLSVCMVLWPNLTPAIFLTFAFAHYASSFAFYFWNENHAYHRARWIAFFAGPALIVATYFLLFSLNVPYVIAVVVLFWNTWHVARQNCGILSIYRNRAGVSDPDRRQKAAANNAILAVSAFLMLWNISTYDQATAFFSFFPEHTLILLRYTIAGFALVTSCHLMILLWKRRQSIGIPEGMFLMTSLAFFYPHLIVRTSSFSSVVTLMPHFVQYLALIWLLHRRKFGATETEVPVVLKRISANNWILVPALLLVGYSFYLLKIWTDAKGLQVSFDNVFGIIVLTHFYIDGLNWSFKRQHLRRTVLPFLLGRNAATTRT